MILGLGALSGLGFKAEGCRGFAWVNQDSYRGKTDSHLFPARPRTSPETKTRGPSRLVQDGRENQGISRKYGKMIGVLIKDWKNNMAITSRFEKLIPKT